MKTKTIAQLKRLEAFLDTDTIASNMAFLGGSIFISLPFVALVYFITEFPNA